MLYKEAKNYKEKETLQHRPQAPVYNKQNRRPNPIINHFSEDDNCFWQQRTVPIVNTVTQCETARKRP